MLLIVIKDIYCKKKEISTQQSSRKFFFAPRKFLFLTHNAKEFIGTRKNFFLRIFFFCVEQF